MNTRQERHARQRIEREYVAAQREINRYKVGKVLQPHNLATISKMQAKAEAQRVEAYQILERQIQRAKDSEAKDREYKRLTEAAQQIIREAAGQRLSRSQAMRVAHLLTKRDRLGGTKEAYNKTLGRNITAAYQINKPRKELSREDKEVFRFLAGIDRRSNRGRQVDR